MLSTNFSTTVGVQRGVWSSIVASRTRWQQAPNRFQSRSSFKNVGSKIKAHLKSVGNASWKDGNFTCTLEGLRQPLALHLKHISFTSAGGEFFSVISYSSISKFPYPDNDCAQWKYLRVICRFWYIRSRQPDGVYTSKIAFEESLRVFSTTPKSFPTGSKTHLQQCFDERKPWSNSSIIPWSNVVSKVEFHKLLLHLIPVPPKSPEIRTRIPHH